MNTIQKPIKLIERIVKASSEKGDVVLYPFAGTGTTFIVCKELKRNFIGFEVDQKLVNVCNNRLKDIKLEQNYNLFSILNKNPAV